MYTKEFIDSCKQEFPRYFRLHKALEENSFEVGELISQTIKENITIQEILKADSLENLRKIAITAERRNKIFDEWHKLYQNELTRRKYLMAANYCILVIKKNNSLKSLNLNSTDLNTKKEIVKKYLNNIFSNNMNENLKKELLSKTLDKVTNVQLDSNFLDELIESVNNFAISDFVKNSSSIENVIVLNNIKKDILVLKRYCSNINEISNISLMLFKRLTDTTSDITNETDNFNHLKDLFNDIAKDVSKYSDFIPIFQLITSPLIDIETLKFRKKYQENISLLLELSSKDLSKIENINAIILIFQNQILDIK